MTALEAISKPRIAFEGKAGPMIKRSIHGGGEYVSILKRPSTQPSGVRWGFEMASNTYSGSQPAPTPQGIGFQKAAPVKGPQISALTQAGY